MKTNILRNKRAQLRRRTKTLFRKAHKLAKVHKIDIAAAGFNAQPIISVALLDGWPPLVLDRWRLLAEHVNE